MENNPFLVTRSTIYLVKTVIKSELYILKNILTVRENRFIIILCTIIAFLSFLAFKKNFIYGNNPLIILAGSLLPVAFPLYITRLYLKKSLKRYSFLISIKSDMEIMKVKQITSQIISIGLFALIVPAGVIPKFYNGYSVYIIFAELIFLVVISSILPYFIKEQIPKLRKTIFPDIWNIRFIPAEFLPSKAILLRDVLFLFRVNKIVIFRFLFSSFITNSVIILYIINNDLKGGFIWGLLFQFLFIFSFILEYSLENNSALLETNFKYAFDIIKGEFIYWSIFIIVYSALLIIVYNSFIPEFSFLEFLLLNVAFLFLLIYTLLLKTAFIYNGFLKNVIFVLGLFPLFFPVIIFYCIRRIKCWI